MACKWQLNSSFYINLLNSTATPIIIIIIIIIIIDCKQFPPKCYHFFSIKTQERHKERNGETLVFLSK